MVARNFKVDWHGKVVEKSLNLNIDKRLSLVGLGLQEQTQANLSVPVTKNQAGEVIVRSRPGEFPRLETALLRNSIFFDRPDTAEVRVGTTVLYGLILEVRMDRSFLVRTLNENLKGIEAVLTAPMNLQGGPEDLLGL